MQNRFGCQEIIRCQSQITKTELSYNCSHSLGVHGVRFVIDIQIPGEPWRTVKGQCMSTDDHVLNAMSV